MPPTENNKYPDGMKSNLRFWVIIHFVLSLAHTFIRKSVYRNSTSAIEVEDTCLRCDLMYDGRLMASLIM